MDNQQDILTVDQLAQMSLMIIVLACMGLPLDRL